MEEFKTTASPSSSKKPFSKNPLQYLYQKKGVTGGGRFLYARRKSGNRDNSRKF